MSGNAYTIARRLSNDPSRTFLLYTLALIGAIAWHDNVDAAVSHALQKPTTRRPTTIMTTLTRSPTVAAWPLDSATVRHFPTPVMSITTWSRPINVDKHN